MDLVRDGIDCVVRAGALQDSTLVARPLGQLAVANVASPAYLQRMGEPVTPGELSGHQAVQYLSPTSGKAFDWEWVRDGAVHGCALDGPVMVNNADAYVACAVAGLGLAQVPVYELADSLHAGELLVVMADYPPPPLPVALVYPAHRHVSRRVRVFGDWLARLFAERAVVSLTRGR